MSVQITHNAGRTCEYDITITDANGDAVVLGVADKIRIKIFEEGKSTLLLDLVSGSPTANGSSVLAANPTRFTLDQDDAVWTPGIYGIEILVVDGLKTKHADEGVFILHETPGGNVG